MSINYSLGRRWPVSTLLAPLSLGLQNAFSSQSLRHYMTLPIDRTMVTTIVIGLIPTSPLEVLQTSLPSIVQSNRFWASFQTAED